MQTPVPGLAHLFSWLWRVEVDLSCCNHNFCLVCIGCFSSSCVLPHQGRMFDQGFITQPCSKHREQVFKCCISSLHAISLHTSALWKWQVSISQGRTRLALTAPITRAIPSPNRRICRSPCRRQTLQTADGPFTAMQALEGTVLHYSSADFSSSTVQLVFLPRLLQYIE